MLSELTAVGRSKFDYRIISRFTTQESDLQGRLTSMSMITGFGHLYRQKPCEIEEILILVEEGDESLDHEIVMKYLDHEIVMRAVSSPCKCSRFCLDANGGHFQQLLFSL